MDPNHFLHTRRDELRSALAATPGLELIDGYRGTLECGRRIARVRFEANDWIRLSHPVGASGPATLDRLRVNHSLAGNARYAGRSRDPVLLADTRLDGVTHLPATFEEFRQSLLRAAKTTSPRRLEKRLRRAVGAKDLDAALRDLEWDEDAVVELEGCWELRPPGPDSPAPVRLTAAGDHLRLHRSVLGPLPEGDAGRAVAELSLRLNAELRLSRLAACESELAVESRLHAGQVSPAWIALAARAVAASFRHCRPLLALVSGEEQVAEHYARLFC